MMTYSGYYYTCATSKEGVVSVNGKYEKFQCLVCASAAGLLRVKHRGLPTGAMVKALAGPVTHRHDKELHARKSGVAP